MIQDMTVGNPAKLIIWFSIPLLIGNIFQQLYSMVDMVIVGRTISVQALAAVGSTGAIAFLVFGFFFGLTNGLAVITAQRFGAKDYDGVRRSVATSIVLSSVVTVFGTVLSVATTGMLLRAMNTPADIFDDAYEYIVILYWGTAAIVFYNLLSCFIRALGDSKTPLWFLLIACAINIVLDFVFILNFKMGVAGAAWATVFSQVVSGALCLWFVAKKFPILRLRREDWQFDWAFAWEHLRVALPMAFQFSITAIGVIVMQQELNKFGSTTIAGFTAGTRIEQLAVQPMFSIGVAIATYAAQNFGAGQIERIRTGVRQCTFVSIIWCVVSGAAIILSGRYLVELFVGGGEAEVVDKARTYIELVAVQFIILGQLFIYRNVLQGMGKSFIPMMAGAVELVVRVVASVELGVLFGYYGVCWATPAAWIGATLLLAVTYFRVMYPRSRQCVVCGKRADCRGCLAAAK